MRTTSTTVFGNLTMVVNVDDGPTVLGRKVVRGAYPEIKVAEARLDYHIADDGTWYCGRVTVVGSVLKTDGTPGKNQSSVDWGRPERGEEGTPDWVVDLAEEHMPRPLRLGGTVLIIPPDKDQ